MNDLSGYKYVLQQCIAGKWVDISFMTEKAAVNLSKSLPTHNWNAVSMSTREDNDEVIGFMFSISHGPVRIADNLDYKG